DSPAPTVRVHHAEKAGQRLGASAVPAFGVDEVRLDVNHVRSRASIEDLFGRVSVGLGLIRNGEEATARGPVERAQDRGGRGSVRRGRRLGNGLAGHQLGPPWRGRRVLLAGEPGDQRREPAPAHLIVMPASTGKVTPVTYLASSDARNST